MTGHALLLVDRFAGRKLVGRGVQRPGIAHGIPNLLVVKPILPRRHHAQHVAVLGDVEQLGQRQPRDYVVVGERGRWDVQPGGRGAIAFAGRAVAGRAVLGIQLAAGQRLRRLRRRGRLLRCLRQGRCRRCREGRHSDQQECQHNESKRGQPVFSLLGWITTKRSPARQATVLYQPCVACCLLYCFNLDFFVFFVARGALEQQVVRFDDAART